VPVVILVDKDELPMWQAGGGSNVGANWQKAHCAGLRAAEEAYYATMKNLGMSGEYGNFPDVSGCHQGPFNPMAKE
jgi:hypothetical protein